MQTADLPEDVLVIHYADLAPGSPPLVRLHILAAVGRLLAAQDQSHIMDNLVRDEQARAALQKWLEGEEASRFWQSADGQVVSLRTCEKHVLIGTRHLLDDLSVLTSQPSRPQLADLDALWRAASVFVDRHIGQDSKSCGADNER